jgi:putative hydrolase of the HAD superfamily
VEGELEVGKPDPKIYRYALEQLEVSESATWMVGDNLEWEVRIPQQLGITAIWHDFRREGLPIGSDVKPDLVVGRIRELVELLV